MRSGSPAPDRHDESRSTDPASPAARAGATVRNTIHRRRRRGGGPAIAAAPDRSARARRRSRPGTGSGARRGGPGILFGGRQAPRGRADDVGEEFGGDITGVAELVTKVSGELMF